MLACVVLFVTNAFAQADDPLKQLNTRATVGAAADYVADEACGQCHSEKYRSYQEVGMAQSLRSPNNAQTIESFGEVYFHAPSQRYYKIEAEDGQLTFHRYQQDKQGNPINALSLPIDWIVGSGNRSRSYMYQTEWGELFLLPLSWYSEENIWAMSPGFEFSNHAGIQRKVQRECMFCHNAYPEVPAESDHYWQVDIFPRELPEGTGCQRCHGPGASHIRTAMSGAGVDQIRSAIVNPAKLAPVERDSVCMQCHLLPSATIAGSRRFGRTDYSFRPGEVLSDYLVHIDVTEQDTPQSERFEINHHGYRLLQSECYQQSEGALGCISCHDPHIKQKGAEFRTSVANVCQDCHNEPHVTPVSATADCVSCHMPTRRTQDVIEVTMTDHRISKGPFDHAKLIAKKPKAVPNFTSLTTLDFGHPPESDEAAIYRAVSAIRATRSVEDAERGLRQTLPIVSPEDPTPLLDLAQAQLYAGLDQLAIQTTAAITARHPEVHVGHSLKGLASLSAGRPETAIPALQKSLSLQEDPETHFNLGLAYEGNGQLAEAKAQMKKAIELRPTMAAAWRALARIHNKNDDRTAALDALSQAITLEPGDLAAYDEIIQLFRASGYMAEFLRYRELAQRLRDNAQ